MMKKWLMSLFAVTMILSGCSNEEKVSSSNKEPASMIEVKVDFKTPNENPNDEKILFQVHVTQDGKNVEDASSVQFEYWQAGNRKNSQMVEGANIGDGMYEAEAALEPDSVYYAYAHTEARGLHVMPKEEFIIGNPDMDKIEKEK